MDKKTTIKDFCESLCNLVELLEKYDKEHGCICEICKAEVEE